MEIRKAKKEDLEFVSRIFVTESSKQPYRQKWNEKRAYLKFLNGLNDQEIFSILLNNRIIGFITLSKTSEKERMCIDECWIEKKNQGKGMGKEVMKFIENYYKKKGIKKMDLVARRSANAFHFYKKLGYIEDSDLVFMNKKI